MRGAAGQGGRRLRTPGRPSAPPGSFQPHAVIPQRIPWKYSPAATISRGAGGSPGFTRGAAGAAERTPGFPQGRAPAPLRPTARPAGPAPPTAPGVTAPRQSPPRPLLPAGRAELGGHLRRGQDVSGRPAAAPLPFPSPLPSPLLLLRSARGATGIGWTGCRSSHNAPRARASHPPPAPHGGAASRSPAGSPPSLAVAARSARGLLTALHHPLADPRTAGPPVPRSRRFLPLPPARAAGGSWAGPAVEKPGPCAGLRFGTAASAAAAGPAIVYKRARSQTFRTGRSEGGVRSVLLRRMKFMEGRA